MTATLHRRLQHRSPTAAMRSIARCTVTGLALTRMMFANRVSMLCQRLPSTLLARQGSLCKSSTNPFPQRHSFPRPNQFADGRST
jgi:hypothetical protein